MDLKEIITIPGKPGLFKTISKTKAGVIVESMTDGKRTQAFATDKVSSLAEITIFADDEEMPLYKVFTTIREKNADQPAPDSKSDDATLKAFFEIIIPTYSRDKFYVSHMKKVVSWYNQMLSHGITEFTAPSLTGEESASPEEPQKATEE